MSRLESVKKLLRCWLWSIPLIPKPNIAIITISAPYLDQAYTDDILDMLRYARDDASIKAVVLRIDSPRGEASLTLPYNGILDNNRLIANIADWLASPD